MNKKKVSVVMAGAMLASSVAPVLAAEVQKSEVSANELGLLQKEVRELLNSKVFADEESNGAFAGHSVYKVQVNRQDTNLDVNSTQEDYQKVFNKLNAGDIVRIVDKGSEEKDGKYYHFTKVPAALKTYTADELKELAGKFYDGENLKPEYSKLIAENDKETGKKSVYFDEATEELVINFANDTKVPGLDNADTLIIKPGDVELKWGEVTDNNNRWDTLYYYNANKEAKPLLASNPTEAKDFYGFVKTTEKTPEDVKPIKGSVVKEYTITPGGYDYSLDELYDGLMLTEKGHDFFDMLENSVEVGRDVKIYTTENDFYTVNANLSKDEEALKDLESKIFGQLKKYNGNYRIQIVLGAKDKLSAETLTITGANKENLARVATWMVNAKARVDILAGDNRYETAAKIAKEYASIKDVSQTGEIVLVNGNALVDGLAAAPLASTKNAPILLTEADHLPTATKNYLKEILAEVRIGHLDAVNISLVGGKTVLNKSLENELRALGFKVERFGGDNREETSLEVADEIASNNKDVFVVGAQGEADAMSIASVAAETKTPIVVSANGGISEDATYKLRNKQVTIIGGENVVSASDEKAIKAEAEGVLRIAGANRKSTNAQIIARYYKNGYVGAAKNVIVAKDGQRNKMELVDALAAANMAAKKDAPIVLATDSLSKEQENALELNAKKSYALYQVGHGVSRDVVKTIAENLGLTNR